MTTYKHGSYAYSNKLKVSKTIESVSGLQVVFGTAPINLVEDISKINQPIISYSFEEAKEQLGYSDDWESFTLCEVMDATFNLYEVAPVIFINVLDPTKHIENVESSVDIVQGNCVLDAQGVLLESILVKLDSESDNLTVDEDYIVNFESDGTVLLRILPTGSIPEEQATLEITYDKLDISLVTEEDIIGGLDVETGISTGLELINQIFPQFGLVPGTIIAPGFSNNPVVEAVMKVKSEVINSLFGAICICDVNTDEVNHYSKVEEWKNENNYTATNEIVTWPMVGVNNSKYYLSTHVAALMALTDSKNDNIPSLSPSNQELTINKVLLKNGNELYIAPDNSNELNGGGIFTTLMWGGGFKGWGNRLGNYNSDIQSTEPSDQFISMKRMRQWLSNQIILKTWERVDGAISTRLATSICDDLNVWMNGLVSSYHLIGGRVEFRKEDNPAEQLENGHLIFRVYVAESAPGELLEFIVEFDSTYYENLFSEE